jgi:hypothetical protein
MKKMMLQMTSGFLQLESTILVTVTAKLFAPQWFFDF